MKPVSLEGRTAIVTGAATGLGNAMAAGLAAAGARVMLVDIAAEALEATAAALGENFDDSRISCVAADVASPAAAAEAVAACLDRFGALHALVNNAGLGPVSIRSNFISEPLRFWTCPPEQWRRILEVNAYGTFLMSHAAVPHMLAQGDGRIVNLSTTWETMLRPGLAAYGPSKAAIEALSCAMTGELEGTGVTVNTILPGLPADTGLVPDDIGLDRSTLLPPAVMVPPVRWLLSADAHWATGRRISAMDWDESLAPAEALERCSEPIAWPEKVTPVLPSRPDAS